MSPATATVPATATNSVPVSAGTSQVNSVNKELTAPETVIYYRAAAEVASIWSNIHAAVCTARSLEVLKELISQCTPGKKIVELCKMGDEMIRTELTPLFPKQKNLSKGIAFPTSVSPNNCACHFSPIEGDYEALAELKAGDLIKIELGVQVNNYPALVGHTLIVGASESNPVTGKLADLITAAHVSAEAALRLMKPGVENDKVTEVIGHIAKDFGVTPVEGSLSFQVSHDNLDAEKQIILNPSEAQKKAHPKCTFAANEAYVIDIVVSTGDGKIRPGRSRVTIYKKTNLSYQLKLKASRNAYSDICSKFGNMAFHFRDVEDEKKFRMGMGECIQHNLVVPYEVLWEKNGEYIARFVYTVLILPNGPLKITDYPFDAKVIKSDKKVTDETIKALLAENPRPEKKKTGNSVHSSPSKKK